MKNDLNSLENEKVQCIYKGTEVKIPLRIFMSEAFGYQVSEKKFVRYKDRGRMFGMSPTEFARLAHDADAIYKVGKMALVKVQIISDFLEYFKEINR